MVQLVDVMCLLHFHIVLWKLVHDLRQILVDGREDGNANREVRSPEQSLALLVASLAHLVTVFVHPARRAAHHFHTSLPCFDVVAVCSLRGSKLNGNIGTPEGLAFEVLLVVNVNNTHNFVPTTQSYLLYHLAHLAVAY